jgi:type I restriction enzyme R subunit
MYARRSYIPNLPVGVDVEKLRAKAQEFLKKHEQDVAIQRLKWNEPLTPEDIAALEEIFLVEGTSSAGIEEAKRVSHGLGLFVRSREGLDRAVAKRSFGSFLNGKTLTANQIEFVDLIIDHFSRRGGLTRRSSTSPHLWTSTLTASLASSRTPK